DVGVVDRALVVAGAPGVAARLDLPDPAHLAGRVAVDHHVGQVDTDDVLGRELREELPVGEAPPFAGEGLDVFDRLVAGDAEREYGVGHRPVGHLLVDRQHVAAPVAPRRGRLGDVDHHLGAASRAL